MHPSRILGVKDRVLQTSRASARRLAARVRRSHDPMEIRRILETKRPNA